MNPPESRNKVTLASGCPPLYVQRAMNKTERHSFQTQQRRPSNPYNMPPSTPYSYSQAPSIKLTRITFTQLSESRFDVRQSVPRSGTDDQL